MSKISLSGFDEIAALIAPTDLKSQRKPDKNWRPLMTEQQNILYDHPAMFLLAHGEKGSAKTFGCLHRFVKECYFTQDALGMIVVAVANQALMGGAWEKLEFEILPTWRDGNRDPDNPDEYLDDGIGLQFQPSRYTKQGILYIWITNAYGGYSKIILISNPHASQLEARMPGFEPTVAFVDELTKTSDPVYFTSIAAQIGRRKGKGSKGVYLGACNPDGPSHWVYTTFFENPYDEETGEHDPDYAEIYFPVGNNTFLREGYADKLKKLYRSSTVDYERLIDGKWVDRASASSLFREVYSADRHVYPLVDGKPNTSLRIAPSPSSPIIIGIDPGISFHSFVLKQRLRVDGKLKWVIFDEFVIIRKQLSFKVIIPALMRRVAWWRKLVSHQSGVVVVADSSAFNQFRAAAGSFDVLDIENEWNKRCASFELPPIRIKPAPQANGSKVERVRLLQNLLADDEIVISSACKWCQGVALKLEGEKHKPGEIPDPIKSMTPVRSDYIHTFDAMTYPILLSVANPSALAAHSGTGTKLIKAS